MAIAARIYQDGRVFGLELYPGKPKAGVLDFPDDRVWPIDFNYDDEKLAAGEHEFLGVETRDITRATDDWLVELDKLDLPHVDVPEAGLFDVTVSDVLRWARKTYPSRHARASA